MKYLIDRNKLQVDIMGAVQISDDNIEVIRKLEEVILSQSVILKVGQAEEAEH